MEARAHMVLSKVKRVILSIDVIACPDCEPVVCAECAACGDPAMCGQCDGSSLLHAPDCDVLYLQGLWR